MNMLSTVEKENNTTIQAGAKNSSAQTRMQRQVEESTDETQYDKETAKFFKTFNKYTGRPHLFYGYVVGFLKKIAKKENGKKRIAVDFGSGTGWLTKRLATRYSEVHGIDTSLPMRKLAFSSTPQDLITNGSVRYAAKAKESIMGQCDLVTAVHVHYHFKPIESLRNNFFGSIASMLKPGGHAILVGCPSDYVADTPDHYQNCVHIKDIPKDILEMATDPETLQDDDGYIGLSCLPRYPLEDGTEMKVSFFARDKSGKQCTATIMDNFWKDETLIDTAKDVGLKLVKRDNLDWDERFPNAYMMMVFQKSKTQPPTPS